MKFITEALKGTSEYKELFSAFKNGRTPAIVTGVSGIHKCTVLYSLIKELQKTAVILSADDGECLRFWEDLSSMGLRAAIYPLRDFSLRDTAGNSHEYERQRLDVLNRFIGKELDVVIATVDAALQYTIPREDLVKRGKKLKAGDETTIKDVLSALVLCGYQRDDQIEGTGQFSHRGGIIDFFPPGLPQPVRIEFWGDEIDTISFFDPETQRRTDPLEEVIISPSVEVLPEDTALLAKKIEAHGASLRGKTAPKAKAVLQSEADKLKAGIYIGSMDKFISMIYDKKTTLLDYFEPEDPYSCSQKAAI